MVGGDVHSLFLGLDLSTQGFSAVILGVDDDEKDNGDKEENTASGAVKEQVYRIYERASVPFSLPSLAQKYRASQGFVEADEDDDKNKSGGEKFAPPMMWLEALDILLGKLNRSYLCRVAAVGGCAQQHGTVYLSDHYPRALGQLQRNIQDVPGEDLLLSDIFSPPPPPIGGRETEAGCTGTQRGPCSSPFARPVCPIWMDSTTTAECAEITRAAKERRREEQQVGVSGKLMADDDEDAVAAISGAPATERFSGPQIRKFYKQCPTVYTEETRRIHLLSSFFCAVLCGKDDVDTPAVMDYAEALGTNLVDADRGEWSALLCAATAPALIDKLPRIARKACVMGTVAPYFCKRYCFPSSCAVVSWTGDNAASFVGSVYYSSVSSLPLASISPIDKQEGGNPLLGSAHCLPPTAVVSLGTSDTICFECSGNNARDKQQQHGLYIANPITGRKVKMLCFKNGGLSRERIRNALGRSHWTLPNENVDEAETITNFLWRKCAPSAGTDGIPQQGGGRPEIALFLLPYYESEIVPHLLNPEPILLFVVRAPPATKQTTSDLWMVQRCSLQDFLRTTFAHLSNEDLLEEKLPGGVGKESIVDHLLRRMFATQALLLRAYAARELGEENTCLSSSSLGWSALRVVGGASRNPTVLDTLRSVFNGAEVEPMANDLGPITAALGGALLARSALSLDSAASRATTGKSDVLACEERAEDHRATPKTAGTAPVSSATDVSGGGGGSGGHDDADMEVAAVRALLKYLDDWVKRRFLKQYA